MPGLARFAKKPPPSPKETGGASSGDGGHSSTSTSERNESTGRQVSFAEGTKNDYFAQPPEQTPLLSDFGFSEEPIPDDRFMAGFLPPPSMEEGISDVFGDVTSAKTGQNNDTGGISLFRGAPKKPTDSSGTVQKPDASVENGGLPKNKEGCSFEPINDDNNSMDIPETANVIENAENQTEDPNRVAKHDLVKQDGAKRNVSNNSSSTFAHAIERNSNAPFARRNISTASEENNSNSIPSQEPFQTSALRVKVMNNPSTERPQDQRPQEVAQQEKTTVLSTNRAKQQDPTVGTNVPAKSIASQLGAQKQSDSSRPPFQADSVSLKLAANSVPNQGLRNTAHIAGGQIPVSSTNTQRASSLSSAAKHQIVGAEYTVPTIQARNTAAVTLVNKSHGPGGPVRGDGGAVLKNIKNALNVRNQPSQSSRPLNSNAFGVLKPSTHTTRNPTSQFSFNRKPSQDSHFPGSTKMVSNGSLKFSGAGQQHPPRVQEEALAPVTPAGQALKSQHDMNTVTPEQEIMHDTVENAKSQSFKVDRNPSRDKKTSLSISTVFKATNNSTDTEVVPAQESTADTIATHSARFDEQQEQHAMFQREFDDMIEAFNEKSISALVLLSEAHADMLFTLDDMMDTQSDLDSVEAMAWEAVETVNQAIPLDSMDES